MKLIPKTSAKMAAIRLSGSPPFGLSPRAALGSVPTGALSSA